VLFRSAGEQFDEEVADGDRRAAVAAFALKPQPGYQRDIEIPGDRILAMRAMRWRRDDALAQRQAMDANIEKAADVTAENEKNQRPEMEGDAGPNVGVENVLKETSGAENR